MLLLRQTFEAARQALLLHARNRMSLVLLSVGGVLGMLGWLLMPDQFTQRASGENFFGGGCIVLLFSFLLPVSVLYFAVQAVHSEISERTSTYQFMRPVPRWSLYLGKWGAISVLGMLISALVLVMIYSGLALPERPWRRGQDIPVDLLVTFLKGVVIACPAYAAVGMLFAALFRRPIVWSLIYVVGWESILSRLPPQAGLQSASVSGPVRRLIYFDYQPSPRSDLPDLLMGNFAGDANDFDWALLGDPITSLMTFTAIVLGIGLWFYSRREYDARAGE